MRVLLGMSGGLDSTYAAQRLIASGHTVAGAVLIMHEHTELEAARESARSLGIPLYEVDCRDRFREAVIANFASEYKRGRTPNPCIICNSEVKFRCLLEEADARGFDKIATGHYARVAFDGERFCLYRGRDGKKDQSYVLFRLGADVLSRLLLPLGDMDKAGVREKARDLGLAAADREESQEICFIADGDYASYIEKNYGASPEGDFIDREGRILGRHRGILHYTVGQRRGLGIALGERMFVSEINPIDQTVRLEPGGRGQVSSFSVSDVRYSGISAPIEKTICVAQVKVRYLASPVGCTAYLYPDRAEVIPDAPIPAVTPGQSAVFFDGDRLLFGGFIEP
jgi:tRNA-specific 2-thiouridylase